MSEWSSTIIRGSACHCCENQGASFTSIGERRTRLCDDCANKYHAWIIAQDAYKRHRLLKAERAELDGLCVVGQQVLRSVWEKHYADVDASDEVLFRIIGVWLEEHKAKREEPVATGSDVKVHAPPPAECGCGPIGHVHESNSC